MGRTNSTYRNYLEEMMNKFRPFRKALREERKEYFDLLWEKAHSMASAASYMNSTNPGLPAIFSMMVGLQQQIEENNVKINEIERKIDCD